MLASSILVLAALASTAHAAPPLRGTSQADRLLGTAGRDFIKGGPGDDVLRGRAAADRLEGGAGSDSIAGDAGRDQLLGGPGADRLEGGPGADRISGAAGRDVIRTRNEGRDVVDCGPGRDTAILDARDVAVRCEVVRRPARPATPAQAPAGSGSSAPAMTTAPLPAAITVTRPQDTPPGPPGDPPADPPADPPPPADTFPQLLAAGDIADCTPPAEQTAALLDALPGTVAVLGDAAYPSGTPDDFVNCYDPTWGRHKHRTRPAVGSHEYETPGAAGYWDYFGLTAGEAGEGWYSYDLGGWHIVVLNSNCAQVGGCGDGSPQMEWLRDDLAAHPSLCTAAYWHTPRFSSGGKHGDDLNLVEFWQVLYEHGVELVMSGDDHHYERFAPQTPYGDLDAGDGVRQFIVGTGGRFLRATSSTPRQNSEVRDDTTHGILRVGLHEASYDWQFVPVEAGTFTDSGSDACH